MRKTVLIYGSALAALVFLLKYIEYRFLVRDFSLEFYLGVVAVLFTAVGVWAGLKITSNKTSAHVQVPLPPSQTSFVLDQDKLKTLGISKREYEVLELMAQGLSNQEIADRLFVSMNTVKTHTSNLFVKLDAKRRTQAIQKAKEMRIIR